MRNVSFSITNEDNKYLLPQPSQTLIYVVDQKRVYFNVRFICYRKTTQPPSADYGKIILTRCCRKFIIIFKFIVNYYKKFEIEFSEKNKAHFIIYLITIYQISIAFQVPYKVLFHNTGMFTVGS